MTKKTSIKNHSPSNPMHGVVGELVFFTASLGITIDPRPYLSGEMKESSMIKQVNVGVASRIGAYSGAAEIPSGARVLHVSGTPGLDAENGQVPETFEMQAELAWENVKKILLAAEMSVENIVKVTHHLIRRQNLVPYREIRSRHLGTHKPASMLTFLPELVWPNMLIELEVVAAK